MNRFLGFAMLGVFASFLFTVVFGAVFAPNSASYATYQVTEINAGVQNFPNGCTAIGIGCIVIGDQSVKVRVGNESGQEAVQGSSVNTQGYTQVPASGGEMGLEDLLSINPAIWFVVLGLLLLAGFARRREKVEKN